MVNSFAVSGMVIAEPEVGATTRSAGHMVSSSIGLSFIPSFEWDSFVSLTKSTIRDFRVRSGSDNGSISSELEASVCIQ
ncbi:hypothetical protein Tco_0496871, partial [Tanacetum coccineum]